MARLPRVLSPVERSDAWRVVTLAAAFVILSWPTWSLRLRGQPISFPWLTLVFGFVILLVVAGWGRRPIPATSACRLRGATTIVMALAAVSVLVVGVERWVDLILWNPLDPLRSDMLVVTREAGRRFLSGRDPYAIYHVPWEAPLPYGPLLWGPFVVAEALRLDVRVVSIAGELFVPILCGVVAIVEAGRARALQAAMWVVLLIAIAFNPDLAVFTLGAHTPSYWPLLPLFAVAAATERWEAAALMLGLLVAGRSTMVSLVPVLLMAVWIADRTRAMKTAAMLVTTVTLLLLPFAIWDVQSFWYGMVTSYPRVIKSVVWGAADQGAIRTIGVTGWLLSHHLERFVEVTQVCALAIVYAVAWHALRRGARPLPWMGCALFTFSMTTLWPVSYLYFDVLLLFVSAAAAETLGRLSPRAIAAGWTLTLAAAIVLVIGAIAIRSPSAIFDLRWTSGARSLYRGFSPTERAGDRRIAWLEEGAGVVVLPRGRATAADIVIDAVARAAPESIDAALNGTPLGTSIVRPEWQSIRLHPPASAWRAGANELVLHASTPRTVAVSRFDVSMPTEPHAR